MKIDSLTSVQGQQKLFDNGNARVTKVDGQGEQPQPQQIASTIYHKDDPVLPANYGTYDIKAVINENVEDPETMNARYNRVQELFGFGIAERSVDLELGYLSGVESLSQGLRDKDWGFSIQDGELQVIEGSDSLSDEERSQITDALKGAGVEYAAQSVANAVIEMIETERSPNGLSRSIGRFDVNQSNFADVVDLRSFMEDYQVGGKYGKGIVNPNDIQARYFGAGTGIMDQVAAKADETFLYKGR
ncbi:hypothetical protein EB809_19825 [Marinobacter sp. R17]|uniref:hypothetical protein n=1 Tax=Marinobacter sp. R17 TaxID=2484250 RepID=UPI000F4B45FE|nr:hypothetical protein [Marinobacter sp. R17]ROT94358.1 hypothetical protein EB809_19825 [Marinobacter sp. R17]